MESAGPRAKCRGGTRDVFGRVSSLGPVAALVQLLQPGIHVGFRLRKPGEEHTIVARARQDVRELEPELFIQDAHTVLNSVDWPGVCAPIRVRAD
jgi:hypothetical protein